MIHGDVPYLIEEAKKQITLEAKTKGFTDIQSITIQNDSDWDQINLQARNLSLFDDKILFHLQNTSAKFSKKALEILVKQSQQKEFNNIFVIVTDKLMKAQQKTKWYQQIEKDGTVIPVYAFSAHELKQWLQLQLQQANFKTDAHIIQLLADLTEGNLLAAQQAIEKLKLLYPNETLTIANK